MRDAAAIDQLRGHLVRKGFPRAYANRTAQELREHWQDLIEEAERQGASREEAALQARQRIGAPEKLAEEICARLRPTSWLGRHPTFGFALFALLVSTVWWAALLGVAGLVTGMFAGHNSPQVEAFRGAVEWIRSSSFLAAPFLCCLLARQYFCGWKPALWGCLVLSIHNGLHYFVVDGAPGSGSVLWGYSMALGNRPDLLAIAAPLIVCALFWFWNGRAEKQGTGELLCE